MSTNSTTAAYIVVKCSTAPQSYCKLRFQSVAAPPQLGDFAGQASGLAKCHWHFSLLKACVSTNSTTRAGFTQDALYVPGGISTTGGV